MGHERAICIGLCAIEAKTAHHSYDGVVVMDGDGEDLPSDVPRLVEQMRTHNGSRIAFACRGRRSEGWLFTLLYHAYRWTHYVLSGVPVRIGNFSMSPDLELRVEPCLMADAGR